MINVNISNEHYYNLNLNQVITEEVFHNIHIDHHTAEKLLMQDESMVDHEFINFRSNYPTRI